MATAGLTFWFDRSARPARKPRQGSAGSGRRERLGAAFDHHLRIAAIELLIMVELEFEPPDPLSDRAEVGDQLVQRRAGQEGTELVPTLGALRPVKTQNLPSS